MSSFLPFSAPIFESMFQFLCKLDPFRRHIAIASGVLPKKLGSVCFRNRLFHVKIISAASNEQSFTVSYLINTLGFSPKRAASVAKHVRFENREKPDLVIKFFESQGFSLAQALKVLSKCPRLFLLDPEKNLLPKIEFFKSKGLLSSDISRLHPTILTRSLEKHIVPSFDFFTNFLPSGEKFVEVLKGFSYIIDQSNAAVIPNINLLRAEGVSESHIIKLLEYQPRTFCRAPHQFKSYVKEVKEMGFNPLKTTFVLAVSILSRLSKSTWARKSTALGWTDDEIRAAFRRYPNFIMCSENMIEAKLEFFVNKMGCKPSIIARYPELLTMSLDKRIIPRGSIIQVLLSKGLVTKLTLGSMFQCTERVFLKRYILYHEKEAEELLKLYRAKLEHPR